MILLALESSDELITGLRRRYPSAHRASMKQTVEMYHREIFPRHFFGSNRSRYRIKPRTTFYLRVIKPVQGQGSGRFVDLLLRGTASRRMKHFATIRATDGGNTIVLRMAAPRYFTNPYIGSLINAQGKPITITQQPDKVAEVTQVNMEDRAKMHAYFLARMNERWNQLKDKKIRKR